jgi:transcriptional regulator with XRE-family HTH domain
MNYNNINKAEGGYAVKSKEEIANVLKRYRHKSGLSTKEVTDLLGQHNIKISPKTLYGWEIGHSQPDANTLLLLCNIYGIDDIMLAFGYGKKGKLPIDVRMPERAKLLEKTEQLDENDCKFVAAYIDGLMTERKGRSRG